MLWLQVGSLWMKLSRTPGSGVSSRKLLITVHPAVEVISMDVLFNAPLRY